MKVLSLQSMKRVQFMKCENRIASNGSAATFVSVRRQVSYCYSCGSSVLKQLVSKFRTQWKKALWGQKRKDTAQYSYDLRSYYLNFDDGFCHDHPSGRGF